MPKGIRVLIERISVRVGLLPDRVLRLPHDPLALAHLAVARRAGAGRNALVPEAVVLWQRRRSGSIACGAQVDHEGSKQPQDPTRGDGHTGTARGCRCTKCGLGTCGLDTEAGQGAGRDVADFPAVEQGNLEGMSDAERTLLGAGVR